MSDQDNVDVVRRGYQAFNEGDAATLTEVLAEDVVWRVPGSNSISGTYEGREATFGMFGKLGELTGGTYRVEVVEVTGDGDAVTVQHRTTAKRGDMTLDMASTNRFRMAGGRVVEAGETPSDLAAFDDFLA